jgi:DNA-binding MarR family transcriptional regulator
MLSRIHVDTMLCLRKAYEKLRHRYILDDRIKDLNGYEVLILLSADEPTSPKSFANLLSCKPAQITGYVSRLEKLGFLKRRISKTDKRSFSFQLTKQGKNKALELLKITQDIFEVNTGLNKEENITLIELLKKL